jgi:NAD(P)-dependent dehydrogenase (short-subunit alcohol dehydrogenase family)
LNSRRAGDLAKMMTESSAVAGLLVGKRSLIFGAGRGIGRATTLALAAAGSAVGVVDVDAERAAVVAGEARALGVLAKPYQADVRSTEDVDRVVRVAASSLGGLDGVVTVVGGMAEFAAFKNVHEYTDPEWDLIVDVNLRYVFRVARAAIAVMIEQGSGGSIVSVGSISGMAGGAPSQPVRLCEGRPCQPGAQRGRGVWPSLNSHERGRARFDRRSSRGERANELRVRRAHRQDPARPARNAGGRRRRHRILRVGSLAVCDRTDAARRRRRHRPLPAPGTERTSERGRVSDRIGFVGLGVMGRPMASNLLAAGHEVDAQDGRERSSEAGDRIIGDRRRSA